ncbi:MAG: hypothetical protein GEV09_18845 [Pseudonocardiaceae bacterium]|nr:hypothetical protein [Pseudonocardiaceae bacterium]
MLGRVGIAVELSADYCRLARWRATDPTQRARADGLHPEQLRHLDRPPAAQRSLLDLLDGGEPA